MKITDEMVEAAITAHAKAKWEGGLVQDHWRAALSAALAAAELPVEIDKSRFEKAPCYICGYSGPGYFQPNQHACAAFYHASPKAPIAVAEQPVAIKPLKWDKLEDDIYENRQWDYRLTFGGDKWGISPVDWPCFDYSYDTLDQAKAAAQQGFEARIRSALTSPTQPAPSHDSALPTVEECHKMAAQVGMRFTPHDPKPLAQPVPQDSGDTGPASTITWEEDTMSDDRSDSCGWLHCFQCIDSPCDSDFDCLCAKAVRDISDAARKTAIEECAKYHDDLADQHHACAAADADPDGQSHHAKRMIEHVKHAAAIRALAEVKP